MKYLCLSLLVVLGMLLTACVSPGPTPVSNSTLKSIPTASADDVAPSSAAPLLQLEVPVPQLPSTELRFSSTGISRFATLAPADGQAACVFVLVPKEVVRPMLRVYQSMGVGKGYQVNEAPLVSGNLLIISERPEAHVIEMTSSWAYIAGKGTLEECFSWARARAGSSVRTGTVIHFFHVTSDGTLKEVNVQDDRGG